MGIGREGHKTAARTTVLANRTKSEEQKKMFEDYQGLIDTANALLDEHAEGFCDILREQVVLEKIDRRFRRILS